MHPKLIFPVLTIIMCLGICSCKKDEVICEPVTYENLQGKWQHDMDEYKLTYDHILPPVFSLDFVSDSFYMTIKQFSGIVSDSAGCGYLSWTEFTKGTYTINNNDIMLDGVYCESDFSVKKSGCYSIGYFEATFRTSICKSRLHMIWLRAAGEPLSGREIIMIKD